MIGFSPLVIPEGLPGVALGVEVGGAGEGASRRLDSAEPTYSMNQPSIWDYLLQPEVRPAPLHLLAYHGNWYVLARNAEKGQIFQRLIRKM